MLRRIGQWIIVCAMALLPHPAWANDAPFLEVDGGLRSFTPFSFFSNGEAINLTSGNLLLQWQEAVVPGRAGMALGFTRSFNGGKTEVAIEEFTKVFSNAVNHPSDSVTCGILIVSGDLGKSGDMVCTHDPVKGDLQRTTYLDATVVIPGLGGVAARVDRTNPDAPQNTIVYDPEVGGWDIAWAPFRGIVILTDVSPNRTAHSRHTMLVKSGGVVEALDGKTGRSFQTGSGNVLLDHLISADGKTDLLKDLKQLTVQDEAGRVFTFVRHTMGPLQYVATYTRRCGHFWNRHTCSDDYTLPGWNVDAFVLQEYRDPFGTVIRTDNAEPSSGTTQNIEMLLTPPGGGTAVSWKTIGRHVFDDHEEWVAPGLNGNRTWVLNVDGDRRITKAVDPEGNVTVYEYSADAGYAGYPRVRKIGLEYLTAPNQFFQVRYPTGGALRYEFFTPVDAGSAFIKYVIVTEIPDFADPQRYFQKYYRVQRAESTEDTVPNVVQTTINMVDGAQVDLAFTKDRGQLLLTKRQVAGNGKAVVANYTWHPNADGKTYDGIDTITVTRDGKSYQAYAATYDAVGRPTAVTDAIKRTTSYNYFLADSTVQAALSADSSLPPPDLSLVVQQKALVTTMNQSVSGQPLVATYQYGGSDICGNAVPVGRVAKVTKSIGGITQTLGEYCYNAEGQVTKQVKGPFGADNAGVTTTYDDQHLFAVSTTTPDGSVAQYTVDPNTGRLLTATAANGAAVTYNYNALGQATAIHYGKHSIVRQYQLNNQGGAPNQVTTTLHDGVQKKDLVVRRTYDGLGLLSRVDQNGAVTTYDYHPTKRLKSVSYPGGRTAEFFYDAFGRMTTKMLSGLEPMYLTYNLTDGAEGLGEDVALSLGLPLGGSATPIYKSRRNLAGQMIAESKFTATGEATTTTYQYDALDGLTAITSPSGMTIGNVINYADNTVARTFPGGETLHVTSVSPLGLMEKLVAGDANGNQVATNLTYDAQHRLASIDRPPTNGTELNDVSITYGAAGSNAEGRLQEIVDHFGTTHFWYGESGAVEGVERKINGLPEPLKVIPTKDAFGNVVQLTYPHGLTIYYERDKQNRVKFVRNGGEKGLLIAELQYDAAGNVIHIAYANGVTTDYSYDLAGRVVRITTKKGDRYDLDEQYTYDARGNKTQVIHLDGAKVIYRYDTFNRLTKAEYYKDAATKPFETQEYGYDLDGNRTHYKDAVKEVTYTIAADKVTGYTIKEADKALITGTFSYTLGNLAEQKEYHNGVLALAKTYAYDQQNRLIDVTVKDPPNHFSTVSHYAYDYVGRRETVTVDGTTTHAGYGEALDPLVDVNDKGEVDAAYIFIGSRRLAAIEGDKLKIFHTDELGNTLKVSDDTGAVTQTVRYDPFGNVTFLNGPDANPFLFAGKPYDRATGLIYFGGRFYDPQLGRYLTRDPLAQGMNHYLYTDNNPLVRRDIFGFWNPISSGGGGEMTGENVFSVDSDSAPGSDSDLTMAGFTTSPIGAGMEGGGYDASGAYLGGLLYSLVALVVHEGFDVTLPSMNLSTIDLMSGGSMASGDSPWYRRGRRSSDPCGELMEICKHISLDQSHPIAHEITHHVRLSQETTVAQETSKPENEIHIPPKSEEIGNGPASDPPPPLRLQEILNDVSGASYVPSAANSTGGFIPVNGYIVPFDSPSYQFSKNAGIAGALYQLPIGLPNTNAPGQAKFTVTTTFPTKPAEVDGQKEEPDKGSLAAQQQQAANNTQAGTNTNGDPVLLHSGDLFQNEVDLKIPGRGIDFAFRRTYRSRILVNGPLGFNWDHNYNKHLVVQANGNLARFDGDARFDIYLKKTDGTYTSPSGRFDVVTPTAEGGWQIRDRHGVINAYGADGFIRSITDPNGNALQFSYTDVVGTPRLATVTDTLGRTITYLYFTDGIAAGKLRQVVDFSGRAVSFAYTDALDLATVTSPSTADYPNGKTVTYTYSSGFGADRPELNHNLLTVTDAKGQVVLTNTYSVFDRVVQQRLGPQGDFQFAYHQLAPVVECTDAGQLATVRYRTDVIDRSGNRTVHDFNCQGNPLQVATFTRSLRADDPASFITHYTYNLDGLVTSITHPAGNRTDFLYTNVAGLAADAARWQAGNLVEIQRVPDDARGGGTPLVTSFTYDPTYNRPTQITDPRGLATTLTYDAQGNVTQITHPTAHDPDGAAQSLVEQFQYNDHGQPTTATDAAGTPTQYGYTEGYLTQTIQDPAGLHLSRTFTRDAVGNITAATDANGKLTQLAVNALNQITAITDPLGHVTKLAYDANNNLAQIDRQGSDTEWITSTIEYNVLNRPTVLTDEIVEGRVAITEWQYDANENLTRAIQPEGNSVAVSYDERDLPYRVTRGFGSAAATTTTYRYDANRNVTQVVDGMDQTTAIAYDGFDRAITRTDPLGFVTEMAYNAINLPTAVRKRGPPAAGGDPATLLAEQTIAYDEVGRAIRTTAADRTITSFYSPQNLLIQSIDPLHRVTTWVRDAIGRPTTVTDPAGNQTLSTYDGEGDLLTTTARELHAMLGAIDRTTTYQYDAARHLTATTDALGHAWHYQYDPLGRVTTISDPLDASGIGAGATTGTGNITHLAYDGLGRVTEHRAEVRTQGSGSGALVATLVTTYAWDDDSRLIAATDAAGSVTKYFYDALNRRTATELADGARYTTTYDKNSRIQNEQTPNGFKIGMTYDADGRLTQRTITQHGIAAGTEHFAYDGLDHLLTAQTLDAGGALQDETLLQHNVFGQVLADAQGGSTVVNTYNAAGDRQNVTYPGALSINVARDGIGRATAITDAVLGDIAHVAYAGVTRPASVAYANGITATFVYDDAARLTQLAWNDVGGANILGHVFGYTKADQLGLDSFMHHSGTGNIYRYDSLARLTKASLGVPDAANHTTDPTPPNFAAQMTYTYDAVHNFTTVARQQAPNDPAHDVQTTYTTNALNQYTARATSVGGAAATDDAFAYDPNGNLLTDDQFLYTYDGHDRLIEVRTAADSKPVAAYRYDALGRRTARLDGATDAITHYVYDGWRVIEERDDSGTVAAAYLYGDAGTPLALRRDGQTYYYHYNPLGSIEALTDASGTVIERFTYDPFGAVTITDAAGTVHPDSVVGNPYYFTGQRRDPATGLYDFRHREYHPGLGRFLQRDPLGYADSLNAYAYAMSNPVNYVDPLGLSTSGAQGNVGAGSPGGWFGGSGASNDSALPLLAYELTEAGKMGGGIAVGVAEGLWSFVRGGFTSLIHPIDTVTGLYDALRNYPATWAHLRQEFAAGIDTLVTGSSYEEGRVLGHIGAWFVGGEALARAVRIGEVGAVGRVEQAVGTSRFGLGEVVFDNGVGRFRDVGTGRFVSAGEALQGEKLYRVFGGKAQPFGQSFTVNLGEIPNDLVRRNLGLFPGNTGRFVMEGTLQDAMGVRVRSALPGPLGEANALEVLVPDASKQINVQRVTGVNPEF